MSETLTASGEVSTPLLYVESKILTRTRVYWVNLPAGEDPAAPILARSVAALNIRCTVFTLFISLGTVLSSDEALFFLATQEQTEGESGTRN